MAKTAREPIRPGGSQREPLYRSAMAPKPNSAGNFFASARFYISLFDEISY
jgi:hypothetical protein